MAFFEIREGPSNTLTIFTSFITL